MTAQPAGAEIRVVHLGRGGYLELEGCQYPIELVEGGSFIICFTPKPRNKETKTRHLALLEDFAGKQQPAWFVEA